MAILPTAQTIHPQVLAAIIAAVVSILAAVITLVAARWQMRSKMLELDLKKDELEKASAKLKAEAETLRQTIMRDVLAKRMEAYAELWSVFITHERNWQLEKKVFDREWALTFLEQLNLCNARHGVFFSEEVYQPFFEYRERLVALVAKSEAGGSISEEDIETLVKVSTYGVRGMKSLAGAMKDDLGSYTRLVIREA